MQTTGRLKSCTRDILTDKMNITVQVDDVNIEEINELSQFDLDVKLTKHKECRKRSLDSNAYFHVLVGKIAEKMQVSKPEAKNMMLGLYGQREFPLANIMVDSSINMMKREDIHVITVGYMTINEVDFTQYQVIRGSHTYNTEEMSHLINGVVSEAKELGIETMTPDEIARMNATWKV